MSSEPSPKCPQCGAPIQEEAPAGLCPNCLMALNLKTETVFSGEGSAAQPPLPPEQIAPHFPQLEILECLGRGGMGVVYKARQKSLNRFVALKLLAPERVTDPKFADRFTREAHALAALNHPHIVTVYDFGLAGGFYFLLMEFVDGVNLRQLLQTKKLLPEEALAIVPPLCDALQYAHEHGIVHRDIKPANLLLDKGGRVKIADFGIAKMVGDTSSVGLAESQPAGTPQYMAPEQKDHQRTDHRADIYSLGVVLYEMLTGELPADKLQPPSRKVQVDVRLDEIVLRALEKAPELRYQTAGEMRTQVETVALTPGSSRREDARPSSASPRIFKVCNSTLTTPEQISTLRGQFFLHRTRGQLILDDRQLTHSRAGINTVIPLAAIRDLSIGHYPRSMNPAGIDLLSVTYEEAGQRKQLLLSPMEGWFGLPSTWNARIAEWFAAIREAVIAATGRAPATTPASQLGVPRGSFWPLLLIAGAPVFIGLIMVLAKSRDGSSLLAGRVLLFSCAAIAIGFLAPWLLGRFSAGRSRPAAPGGLVLIGVGLALGWIQMSDGKRAHDMSLAFMASQIPSLQQQWTAAKNEEFLIRNSLRAFESRTANPRTDVERREVEDGHQRLTNGLARAVERGDTLNKAAMDYTEKINHLQFPDPGTLKRALLFSVPLLLAGLALLFWRSGGGSQAGKSLFAIYAILFVLFLPVLLFGFLWMQYFAHRAQSPVAATNSNPNSVIPVIQGAKPPVDVRGLNGPVSPPVLDPKSGGAGAAETTVTRPFPLRHKLASEMADDLRPILLGTPGHEAKPSADNQELLVTAPPDVLSRVQTFITVNDWPDAITRGSNFEYPRGSVTRAARSFFYACAIEDAAEAFARQLSCGVLARLKGDTKSQEFENYQMGGVPDAEWEKSLRGDWPGKQEAIQRLVREWNRYPLKRLTEDPGIAIGFGLKHFCSVSFEGAPKRSYQIIIEPDRTRPPDNKETSFLFSSLPPWWGAVSSQPEKLASGATIATKSGSFDIKPGLKLVITENADGRNRTPGSSVSAELVWQAQGATRPTSTYDIPLSDGLPFAVAWREEGKVVWVSCGAMLGSGREEHIARYLRTLTIRSPGDVDEQSVPVGANTDAADQQVYRALPEDVRRAFERLGK